MENPNTYNDEGYARYSVEASDAIVNMWEAGASMEDIENELANGLENATGKRCSVSIGVAP